MSGRHHAGHAQAAKHVGVSDIRSRENNINAAARYLAFLRDTYFNEPRIRPRDRVRFTLEAYNMGPGRVQRLREAARKMGLDPNRWFRTSRSPP